MSHLGTTSPFLPLPDGIVIASVHPTVSRLVVQVAGSHPKAFCPLCQQPSERVHGDYMRTVADLPCGGRRVILSLTVRKFVCGTPTCPRKIFTERLSDLVQAYARMTNRLREAVQALGFATCGEMSERLAPKLGMQAIEIPPSLPPKPRIPCRMSATRASWLFVSQAGKLDAKQKQHVGQIRAGHPDLERAYQLSQEFVMMLAERREAALDTWLTQAEHSGLPEFKKMAHGISQDYAAVKAAFSSEWSNGQVEGQITRLKYLKPQMYGRAKFDLLRLRVLHAA